MVIKMKFFEIVFVFMFCCIAGWINEVIFRSVKNKKLINPGFMHGCSLPIYGCGGVIMYLISNAEITFVDNQIVKMVIILFFAIIIMTLLELFTGLFFVNVYHVMLWDYSNEWGNYKGIICPLFSIIWGLFCAIFYYLINPWLKQLAVFASTNNIMIFVLGFYIGVFIVDMISSLNLMSKIKNYAKQIKENVHLMRLKIKSSEVFKKSIIIKSLFKINSAVKKYLKDKNDSQDKNNQKEK